MAKGFLNALKGVDAFGKVRHNPLRVAMRQMVGNHELTVERRRWRMSR